MARSYSLLPNLGDTPVGAGHARDSTRSKIVMRLITVVIAPMGRSYKLAKHHL